jgi:hypothetical protein
VQGMTQAELLLKWGGYEEALALVPMLQGALAPPIAPRRQAASVITLCRVLAANDRLPADGAVLQRVREIGRSGPEVKLPEHLKVKALMAEAEAQIRRHRPELATEPLRLAAGRLSADERLREDKALPARHGLLWALMLRQSGQLSAALSTLQDTHAEAARNFGADAVLTQLIAANWAVTLHMQQDASQALALSTQATTVLTALFGAESPTVTQLQHLQSVPPARLFAKGAATAPSVWPPEFFI